MDGKLQELMERACQLGRLLPDENDIDTDDADQVAGIKIILAEFKEAEAAMWARIRELNRAKS